MGSTFFVDPDWERRIIAENERRISRAEELRRVVTPDLAADLTAYSRLYPTMSPGVAMGLTMAGIVPEDPIANEIAMKDYDAQEQSGPLGWLDSLVNVIQGGARVGMAGFQTAWEEGIARPLRTGVRIYQGESFEDAYHNAETSYGLAGDRLERYRQVAGAGLFRFSVGLEDPADLCADLDRVL